MGRTIFIGDIHGCAQEFQDLISLLGVDPQQDKVYLTGDAFTKGPDPLGVWETIWQLSAHMVLGNHDVALLNRLEKRLKGKEKKIKPAHKKTLDDLMHVAQDVVEWIKHLPLYIESDDFLLVHAGINPEKGLAKTTKDEFLTIRTWPPQSGIVGKRWHEAYEPSWPVLIFGHDAPNGLVLREYDGRARVVGLDTGCVYGRLLSAYILEESRVVQVKSLQPLQVFGTGGS